MPKTRSSTRRATSPAEDEAEGAKKPAKKTLGKKGAEAGAKGKSAAKGLSNLGNTCFFNSVMQNMVRTDMMRERMLEFSKAMEVKDEDGEKEEEVKDYGEFGLMTENLVDFFEEMGKTSSKTNN
eukprot:1541401-Rhodomonas_salina.1